MLAEGFSSHTLPVIVHYDPSRKVPPPQVDPGLVATLLKQLAVYTDGEGAIRRARDADLTERGMTLHFNDDEKRVFFKVRVPRYLHPSIVRALTVI